MRATSSSPSAAAPYPLSGTFARLAPFAPSDLITPDAWAAVVDHVGVLPAALTTWMYLEARLHDGDARIDTILEIDEVGRAILAGENLRHRIPPTLAAHPAWSRIAAFCRAYGPGTPLASIVDHIWLEFDVPLAPSEEVPVPGVFICFGELPPHVGGRAPAAFARAKLALGTLLGREPTAEVAARLERLFLSLPTHGYVPYFGVFFGRDTELVRVCVNGVSPDELPIFLGDVEWTGTLAPLAPYAEPLVRLRSFSPHPVLGMLHLDVGVRCASRLGVEYQLARAPQLAGTLGDEAMLERFIADGLGARTRVDALRQWCGNSLEYLPHQLWRSRLVRWVNHLKLVLEADGRMTLKAYPCAFYDAAPLGGGRVPLWRPRRSIATATIQ